MSPRRPIVKKTGGGPAGRSEFSQNDHEGSEDDWDSSPNFGTSFRGIRSGLPSRTVLTHKSPRGVTQTTRSDDWKTDPGYAPWIKRWPGIAISWQTREQAELAVRNGLYMEDNIIEEEGFINGRNGHG